MRRWSEEVEVKNEVMASFGASRRPGRKKGVNAWTKERKRAASGRKEEGNRNKEKRRA